MQPNNDPKELSPEAKTKRVRYITIAIIVFLVLVLAYMVSNVKPDPEDLPANTQQSAQPES